MPRALALCLLLAAAPVHSADPALVAEGASLYADFCFDCHGPTATEGEAGDIRGLPEAVIAHAFRGFEMMPAFDFEPAEIAAIAAYLGDLATD
ncbi:c-type cytochrome [Rubrimonas sp.]|uniref:c-type cytochrome n=1 Tax=Rubrimonas sp. TaxID=2036015 RepID=UPI002FDECCD9